MADNLFVREADALLSALRRGRPNQADYTENIHTDRSEAGSANHKMLANGAAILDPRSSAGLQAQILDYGEWYVDQPLHENEGFTGSGAYRPAIMFGTYALAGAALEKGRGALAARLMQRCRADVHYLILGAATGQAKAVRDHKLGEAGRAVALIGDGRRQGLPGAPGVPYFAIAGKRCHVREGNGHGGAFEYLDGLAQSLIVAQALGMIGRSGASWHAHFEAIRERWPSLPPWGLSPADQAAAREFLKYVAEPVRARPIFAAASGFLPKHPFAFVRWEDGDVAAVAWHLDRSSTGGRSVDRVAPDGTHFIGSADTGGRDNGPPVDVRAQTTVETSTGFVSRWDDGQGRAIVTPKPQGVAEAWRVEGSPAGLRFLVPGVGESSAPPPIPPPAEGPGIPNPPKPPRRRRWWQVWK